MRSNFLGLSILFLCVCLQGSSFASSFSDLNEVDQHLDHYADINQNHHDNIDDETHAHTHKHSEEGKEHEHSHEHKKISHHKARLFRPGEYLNVAPTGEISKNGYREESLFSNSHPNELFRPPIV